MSTGISDKALSLGFLLPLHYSSFSSSSGLVVPPSEIWNLCVLFNIFSSHTSYLVRHQSLILLSFWLYFWSFSLFPFVYWVLSASLSLSLSLSFNFQFCFLLHSSSFSAFPITHRKNKRFFFFLCIYEILMVLKYEIEHFLFFFLKPVLNYIFMQTLIDFYCCCCFYGSADLDRKRKNNFYCRINEVVFSLWAT